MPEISLLLGLFLASYLLYILSYEKEALHGINFIFIQLIEMTKLRSYPEKF